MTPVAAMGNGMKAVSKIVRVTGMAGVLTACVTINIYFPAAAAEKAADRVIDEVWQIEKDSAPPAAKPGDKPAGDKPAGDKPAGKGEAP